jgi:NADH dehydrogenase [ubiquinone] 1 alpha subcomplex assembly factor 2
MMKQLAAEADERWRSTPRYIDGPERRQPAPPVAINETGKPSTAQSELGDTPGVKDVSIENQEDVPQASEKQAKGKKQREEMPWQKPQAGAPGERWQPESWTPGVVERR